MADCLETDKDIFDSILKSEEVSITQGRKEGEKRGERTSTLNSFSEGLKEGAAIAAEVGFYFGVCSCLLTNKQKLELQGKSNEKLWKRVDKMLERLKLVEETVGKEEISCEEVMAQIRDEFKIISSNFKLPINLHKRDPNEI